MILRFLGGAQEVGRSCIYVETKNTRFLFDAGIMVGQTEGKEGGIEKKGDIYPRVESIDELEALILSHAHLDHSGYVPRLVKDLKVPFYATPPTQDISEKLWIDHIRLSKNESKATNGSDDESTLYELNDVHFVRKYAQDIRYRVKTKIGRGEEKDEFWLYRAGHILGSSMIGLRVGGPGGKILLYTSDINTRHTRTLHQLDLNLPPINYLIVESTYGAPWDQHPSLKKMEKEFLKAIKTTIDEGGKVIIPVFAVGRAQEVMLTIEAYISSKYLQEVPVFIDGMIRKINKIYTLYWEWLRPEIQKSIRYTGKNPFKSNIFRTVTDRDEPLKEGEPCIITTTSGMLEGGPVIHYLEHLASDPKNLIALTGYQVQGSRGRSLMDGKKTIQLPSGETVKIESEVKFFDFSAHADQGGLLRFISSLKNLEQVYIVHGEGNKPKLLAEKIEEISGAEVFVPGICDQFDTKR